MVSANDILDSVDALISRFAPHRILLFGSYAYGQPNEDSDVDLLVLTKRKPTAALAARMRLALDRTLPFDIIVREQARVLLRIRMNDFFLREAIEQGITLHATDNPRMGENGRRRLRRRLAAAAIPKRKSA